MMVVIRGAGDLATGIAVRLHRAGFGVVMLECAAPTAIRRNVCFSEALFLGEMCVEGVRAVHARDAVDAFALACEGGAIAVLVDPEGACIERFRPDAVVDATISKRNIGTRMDMAPAVVGVGPGFTAGIDCHAVVETMRGHHLGRVLYEGAALPDTGIPGNIGGYTVERVVRAPKAGVFTPVKNIGDIVNEGEAVAYVDGVAVASALTGTLRGILRGPVSVLKDMKVADVDPRCVQGHSSTVSDKARAVAGGVLEAIMHVSGCLRQGQAEQVLSRARALGFLPERPSRESMAACVDEPMFSRVQARRPRAEAMCLS